EFFVGDQHQLDRAMPPNMQKSSFETYYSGGYTQSPVTIFTRAFRLSQKGWEHQAGYPGHGAYLEFHKKHHGGWLRSWRSPQNEMDLAYKQPYVPEETFGKRIPDHAGHFKSLIKQSLEANYHIVGKPKLALCAFDSELFGHWWFEGPSWLYYMLEWIGKD